MECFTTTYEIRDMKYAVSLFTVMFKYYEATVKRIPVFHIML